MCTEQGRKKSDDGQARAVKKGQEPIDQENIFQAGKGRKLPGAYASVPVWWRRFLFSVLDPRELVVYMQLCLLFMPPNNTSPVSTEMLRVQSRLKKRDQVEKALGELVRLGFILREKRSMPRVHVGAYPRNFYQRPNIKHTLTRLLEERLIDGELLPCGSTPPEWDVYLNDRVVENGLRELLGQSYDRYHQKGKTAAALLSALQPVSRAPHRSKVRKGS